MDYPMLTDADIRKILPFSVPVRRNDRLKQAAWCNMELGDDALLGAINPSMDWGWYYFSGPFVNFYFKSEARAVEFKLRFG